MFCFIFFLQVMYSPVSYMPYRSSYIVQPPVPSYPQKSAYQYIPATAQAYGSYSSPVQKIRYVAAPVASYNYAPATKSILPPAARMFAVPGSWNSPLGLLKK